MIIFGGYAGRLGFFSDIWTFNIKKKQWNSIDVKDMPPARYSHSAVYDSTNKQMIIFGGTGRIDDKTGKMFNDTWIFNIKKKQWEEIPSVGKVPPERQYHTAIYDPVNRQMIIFGGIGISEPSGRKNLSDIWAFDLKKKQWEEITTTEAPPERWSHTAIYDPVNKQMIIFGGRGKLTDLSDIWAFDIEKKQWKEIK